MHDNMNYPNLVTGRLTESDLDAHLDALGTSRRTSVADDRRAFLEQMQDRLDAIAARTTARDERLFVQGGPKRPYTPKGCDWQGRRQDRAYVPEDGTAPGRRTRGQRRPPMTRADALLLAGVLLMGGAAVGSFLWVAWPAIVAAVRGML